MTQHVLFVFLQSITENGDIQEFGHKWQQKSAAASKDTAALSICGLLLLPVVVDVLDVLVILHEVDHLSHVLDVILVGELDVVLGHHVDAGGDEGIALLLQSLDDGVEVNLTM